MLDFWQEAILKQSKKSRRNRNAADSICISLSNCKNYITFSKFYFLSILLSLRAFDYILKNHNFRLRHHHFLF